MQKKLTITLGEQVYDGFVRHRRTPPYQPLY